jgi:type II secretory pathway component PulJ
MKAQRGFTLYELALMIGLLIWGAIVGTAAWTIFHFVRKFW